MRVKLNNLITKLKSIDYKKMYHQNNILIIFVVGAFLNGLLLRSLTIKNYFSAGPILGDLIIAFLIATISFLVNEKRRIYYFLFWAVIFAAVGVINSLYFTFYTSFASVSLLANTVYVADVSTAITKNVLKWQDFLYVLYPLVIIIIYRVNRKEKPEVNSLSDKRGFFNSMVATGIFFLIFMSGLTGLDVSRFHNQWNREYLVSRYGVYIYQGNDVIKSIQPKITSIFGFDQALKDYREFYEEEVPISENKYTDIFEGKNIITIHAESIQQFLMDTSFNGEPVTPNLNKIASEGLNFTNYYSQVSVGTSSDAEFTLNTSLMPSSSGTVFVSYFDNYYVTIPKLLKEKGYMSFSMHANNCDFWNREVMHDHMGYDNFYCKPDYTIADDQIIGLGLSDVEFFKQSVSLLKEANETSKKPFYTTMIMLSNHTPFDEIEKYGEYPVDMKVNEINEFGEEVIVSKPYMEDTKLGNYFKSSHYADYAIGVLMEELETAGLLDNTVIVIYGDHDARLPKKDYRLFYNYNPETDDMYDEDALNYQEVDYYSYELNRKVPFIIWSKDLKTPQTIPEMMGSYNILPTLGNMFGFSSPYALGKDMFSIEPETNLVPFSNGNWVTNKMYYNNQKNAYRLLVEEEITEEYIKENSSKTDKILNISNDITMYDLIRVDEEQKELLEEIKE